MATLNFEKNLDGTFKKKLDMFYIMMPS